MLIIKVLLTIVKIINKKNTKLNLNTSKVIKCMTWLEERKEKEKEYQYV